MAMAERAALSPVETRRPGRRWLPRRFLTVYLIWLAATALAVTPEIARYDAESGRIATLARDLAGPTARPAETAVRIADAVRERVSLRDPATATSALGATAWSAWANGTADTREGARLIVDLLRARSIAASTLNLTDSRTGIRHVAVAYEADGAWRLLDGLNARDDFHAWSAGNDAPLAELVTSARAGDGATVYTAENPYFDRYSFFDWQALLGDTAEVYQRVPFPAWVTTAIENPPIATGLIKLAAAFGVLLILRALWSSLTKAGRRDS
jgi:hypothetical protein